MPIGNNTETQVVWTDYITVEEIQALANDSISTKTYYSFDEFFNDINNPLVESEKFIPNQELIDILLPIWQANLPIVEDFIEQFN